MLTRPESHRRRKGTGAEEYVSIQRQRSCPILTYRSTQQIHVRRARRQPFHLLVPPRRARPKNVSTTPLPPHQSNTPSMDTHRSERDQRDATRKAAWDSAARNEGVNRNLQSMSGGAKKGTLADRAKYQFEADSEDDEMENEIDGNLDALHGAAKRLNALGKAMGEEVDTQNSKFHRSVWVILVVKWMWMWLLTMRRTY
jgi:hypothetical protein